MQVLWIFALIGAACAYHDNHVRMPQANSPLETEYEWKYFDYEWESENQKQKYIRSGRYSPENIVPIDVDRAMDGRTFVTVVRTTGVPATLHTISDKKGESGPLLKPYPDWSWYPQYLRCCKIVNVFKVAIDKCNRLWVLDTGKIDEKFVCPAKLLAFDLSTDNVVFSETIPDDVARNRRGEGLLVTPIVETEDCKQTAVYMADMVGFGVVVWNGSDFLRLPDSQEFGPQERNANFDIAGKRFRLFGGMFGMALTPDNRVLAFKPLASRSINEFQTEELKVFNGGMIHMNGGDDVFSSQASALAISRDRIMFYGLTHEIAIGCWNMNSSIDSSSNYKIAVQDKERLQFASGMKVINNPSDPNEEQLLVMTNRLQKIFTNTLNLDEVNFRVLKANVKDLVRGAGCDKNENENINKNVYRVFKLG